MKYVIRFGENFLLWKCPFGELSARELSFEKMSVGELFVKEISSGNCLSGEVEDFSVANILNLLFLICGCFFIFPLKLPMPSCENIKITN